MDHGIDSHKRKDGFDGQKLISLPPSVYENASVDNPLLSQLFITHIGYFPHASFHYRERKHGCKDNILIYCLQGKGWFQIGKTKHEINPNQFFHVPACQEYMQYGADDEIPWTIYWVHYSGRDMQSFNQALAIGKDTGPVDIAFNEKALSIWENMYESLAMGYSRDNLCNANLCLYHFLATFFYPDKHIKTGEEPDFVTKTTHFMRTNIENRLTLDDFAAMHNLSSSHFSSLFRKATGISPVDYFIQLKMQRACQLLYDQELRIKEVAHAVGYEDQYFFSRIFKRLMGVSPLQYRARNTKTNNRNPDRT